MAGGWSTCGWPPDEPGMRPLLALGASALAAATATPDGCPPDAAEPTVLPAAWVPAGQRTPTAAGAAGPGPVCQPATTTSPAAGGGAGGGAVFDPGDIASAEGFYDAGAMTA